MKRKYNRLLCIILSVFLLLSALPLTVHAAAKTYSVSTPQELKAAVDEINGAGAGDYIISLADDIEGGYINIDNGNAVVTIIGNGNTLSATLSAILVSNGATVNLGDGNSELFLTSDNNNDTPGIVNVLGTDSVCNMYEGVTLKDHIGQNYFGGGVTVEGGTFHMYGGTINNCGIDSGAVCFGGGVAVIAGGKFIMEDGVISNCYAKSDYVVEPNTNNFFTAMGGGVFVTAGSTFTMNKGTISNCEATNFGGGVAMAISDSMHGNNEFDLYGIGNPQSVVAINGGTITGNKAESGAGVFVSGYFTAYAAGFIMELPESELEPNPGLFINGGEISSNKATDAGGGVHISMVKSKAQIHNAKITNNTAKTGAGIENFRYNTQLDIDGCTITGNKASSNGGGIAAFLNSGYGQVGYTKIKGTTITGNTSGDRGAGVYYDAESEVRLSGANVIQENIYNGKENNLNVLSLDKPVTVDGDLTGSQIGLSDPTLWDDGKSDIDEDAVSTERLTSGYKANNASLIPADAFTSDHEGWVVDFGEKKTEQVEVGRTYSYKADKYDNTVNVTDGGPIVIDGTKRHIRLKAVTFDSGTADSVNTIYTDMLTRYRNKYEFKGNTNYGDEYFYDEISGKYVTLYIWGTVVYIFVGDYDAVYYEIDRSCDCLLYAGVSHQQFAQDGEIVFQYYEVSPTANLYTNPVYKSTASETNIDLLYNTPLDFNGEDTTTFLERNDLGIITDKLVVNKSSEVVDIQYDTVTTDYTNEVRLVRKTTVDYHINNRTIAKDKYNGNDIFTSYVAEATGKPVTVGETINSFYTIPEIKPTAKNSCPYIFKGWYYDKVNNNDTRPVNFRTDKYIAGRDIYAHWIEVKNVAKDGKDEYNLPGGETEYGGFDLTGVQVRSRVYDTNFGNELKPGGLRFMTSLSMDVVNQINAIQDDNIEYGYVAATRADWINAHQQKGDKLQYVSATANGKNTSTYNEERPQDYFGFAKNVVCTSNKTNTGGVVKEDHRNFKDYLLYTLVITYTSGKELGENVLARPYIKYTDANGLERVAYSEYRGKSNTLGGCYTSYNAVAPTP